MSSRGMCALSLILRLLIVVCQHCTETKTHAVVLHMKTRMLWCYMCDMEVLDEPSLLRRESGDENETDNTSQPVYDVTKTHAPVRSCA